MTDNKLAVVDIDIDIDIEELEDKVAPSGPRQTDCNLSSFFRAR